MPRFDRERTSIYYEDHGEGFPLLLIAPGGMNSSIGIWPNAPINALVEYAGDFRLVAMDQRNAGQSSGPLAADDPWGAYADDQLALLDHLGVGRFHVMGCCIGGSFILKLIEQAPGRVVSAVLEQPIGLIESNLERFEVMWQGWAEQLVAARPELTAEEVDAFSRAMWERDFVVSVPREFVATIETPILVLPGHDVFHPGETGRAIAALAPGGERLEPWAFPPETRAAAIVAVREFLIRHTPI